MNHDTEAPLGWTVQPGDDVTVVRFAGSVDLDTRDEFAEGVNSAMDGTSPLVILDLTDIDFLGSVGLAVLVQAHQKAEATARGVRIVDGTSMVRRVLDISGLSDFLAVYPNLDEAHETR